LYRPITSQHSAGLIVIPSKEQTEHQSLSIALRDTFLPHDARSAKRGIAIISHPFLSVCPIRLSVCRSVCNVDVPWSYNLVQFESNYSTIQLWVRLRFSQSKHRQSYSKGNTPKIAQNRCGVLFSAKNLQYI